MYHSFHIPVLGLGYSIDTPLKVAKYGISSVVSIVDDELTERMRKYHAQLNQEPYQPISKSDHDFRAQRITAYLNLLNKLVADQIARLKASDFDQPNDLCTYFDLLPETSAWKTKYHSMIQMPKGPEKIKAQILLKEAIKAGEINVNIMSKVDKVNHKGGVYLGDENTDALAAIRGFAKSELDSSVVISAGLNPRLFSYMEKLEGFKPGPEGHVPKKIILKVSDYRSAFIQAKVLAKKGLWVSEFRIESGLNCGGHAFATDGFLLGPILQEFKDNSDEMYTALSQLYMQALLQKETDRNIYSPPRQKITAQGGVGTAEEHNFLITEYNLTSIGWGSPFLLVPEATNVDANTLSDLSSASESDFYLSAASPLGIPFNNFSKSTSELQRLARIRRGKPGSPCTKKYLVSDTEFTKEPICTASRKYQQLKITQIRNLNLDDDELEVRIASITQKICLCEGLCASAYLKADLIKANENIAVSICPGPNIAYFKGPYSLKQMVGHIYGRLNLLEGVERPNMFIKELDLYIKFRKEHLADFQIGVKKDKYLTQFCQQLLSGVAYYKNLIENSDKTLELWNSDQLKRFENSIKNLQIVSELSIST
jgi:hypothetical protein